MQIVRPRSVLLPLLLLSLLVGRVSVRTARAEGDAPAETPNRWEAKIREFEAGDRRQMPPENGLLFVGSSSIVGWNLERHFPNMSVVNRGFGGSEIADSVHFAERIILPYRPRVIVLYAGDNDIARGKTPQTVLADYQAFVQKVRNTLPKTKIVFVAIKPSISRWHLVEKMREANRLIREVADDDPQQVFVDIDPPMIGDDGKPKAALFKPDGLHLNEDGYQLWSSLVRPHLK
jgi:lysophospholipase L1-like esterase